MHGCVWIRAQQVMAGNTPSPLILLGSSDHHSVWVVCPIHAWLFTRCAQLGAVMGA
jgi:hypothetical protein